MRKHVCWLLAVMMVLALCGAALADPDEGPTSSKDPAVPNVFYLEMDRPLESGESVSVSGGSIIHSNDIWKAIQADDHAESLPTTEDIGSRPVAAKREIDLKLNRSAGALTLNFYKGYYNSLGSVSVLITKNNEYMLDDYKLVQLGVYKKNGDMWERPLYWGVPGKNYLSLLPPASGTADGPYRLVFKNDGGYYLDQYYVVELTVNWNIAAQTPSTPETPSESTPTTPESPSSETVPTMPTSNFTTSPDIEQDTTQAPTSGFPSVTLNNIKDSSGNKPQAGTTFYIWINIISRLSVAANLAADVQGPYVIKAGEDGTLDLDVSKLKDTNGNAVNFPGGICTVTYQSEDGKFSGQTSEVKLAATSTTTTSGKSGGGCDAGLGGLTALVLLAALLMRKR